jgi:acetolactate synthase-1/3 small subunit
MSGFSLRGWGWVGFPALQFFLLPPRDLAEALDVCGSSLKPALSAVRAILYSGPIMRHIIGILLQNESGALNRVAGLFSNRGYNIESLSVAPTDDPTVSRITLVTEGSDAVVLQILNQLNKLIDVVEVQDMTRGEHLERELVLLKMHVKPERKDALRGYVVRNGGRVLDPASDCFIVELAASVAEVSEFVREMSEQAELAEVVRSGALGVTRDARTLRVVE